MVLSTVIAILAFIVAAAALWIVDRISSNVMRQSQEALNDHAVAIQRLTNSHDDEVTRLKRHIKLIDMELQSYRQEFRGMLNDQSKEIRDLTAFKNEFGHPRKDRSNSAG